MSISNEELNHARAQAMGAELGARYNVLWTQVVWLNAKWTEFVALYADSPERIDLLNEAAPYFFGQLQYTLWSDMLLHLARLTDSPRSAGKENFTIRGIQTVIRDGTLAADVEQLVNEAVERCEFVKQWRNRWLAHMDLGLALEQPATPLPSANRKSFRAALDAVGRVVQRIHAAYFPDSQLALSTPILGPGGVDALVSCLKHGMEAQADIDAGGKRPEGEP